jgi:hypothetical protein
VVQRRETEARQREGRGKTDRRQKTEDRDKTERLAPDFASDGGNQEGASDAGNQEGRRPHSYHLFTARRIIKA